MCIDKRISKKSASSLRDGNNALCLFHNKRLTLFNKKLICMFAKTTFVTNVITYIGQYKFVGENELIDHRKKKIPSLKKFCKLLYKHFILTQGSVFLKSFIQKRVKTITGHDFSK